MISSEEIEAAAKKLEVYDVEQGGWEQEPHGFQTNATHVLLHLAKDISVKNFGDPRVAREAIAPDSLQYSIRLLRWTGQTASWALPDSTERKRVDTAAYKFGTLPKHQVAFLEATSNLASFLHEADHESTCVDIEVRRPKQARYTGRLLVYGAVLQADTFDFDLVQAFDDRLTTLRERFDIPEPTN